MLVPFWGGRAPLYSFWGVPGTLSCPSWVPSGTGDRAQALPRGLSKKEKWKLNFIGGNPLPGRKHVNKHMKKNNKFENTFLEPCMCHINPPPSAQWRPRLPHVAQKHPQRPKKSLKKGVTPWMLCFFGHRGRKQSTRDVETTRNSH